MNGITDKPPVYGFGLDFNYALWTKGTVLTLVNVPWNNDYRDIVKFADRTALNTYIDSIENSGIVLNDLSYVKPNEPLRIPIPFNAAYRYNYIRASNPLQPINGDTTKDFYYFITDVRYLAPNTTELVVQLDIWQTFGYDVTFGNSYVERGHIGIANESNFDNFGRDYLTVPEGLDFGGEYQIAGRAAEKIISTTVTNVQGYNIRSFDYDVLIVSTVDLSADAGTVDAPQLHSATGTIFEGLPNGANIYVCTWQAFQQFISMASGAPWITQGIISITAVPKLTRYDPNFGYVPDANGLTDATGYMPVPQVHSLSVDWRNTLDFSKNIDPKYKNLKKFYTYPYMVIELTMWTGTPVIIKPESWNDANATVIERATLMPPTQKIQAYPVRYNANDANTTYVPIGGPTITDYNLIHGGDDAGEFLDVTTHISNLPTMAVVNNGAINYLASNFAGIPYARQSADWTQQRALRGNQTSYDQASKGISNSKLANQLERAGMGSITANNNLKISQDVANNSLVSALNGLGNGAAGLAASGGGALTGMIMGGVNAQVAIDTANRNTTTSQVVSRGQNNVANNQAAYVRDTNKDLADWAARGDYENTIAGINAQVRDASMTQPTTSGQMGGESSNIIFDNFQISLRWKVIDKASATSIGDYWLRYGYAINRFHDMHNGIMVMEKFTYWKLQETYIASANMPEAIKQAIRGIFEKGVTVWADPTYIGSIDISDNAPLGGITL